MRRAMLVVLIACGSDRDPTPSERFMSVPPRTSPPTAILPTVDPCGRTDSITLDGGRFTYTIPCRPYDRMRDLADPAP